MTEQECISKVNKLIEDLERMVNQHKLDAGLFILTLEWQRRIRIMHESKAGAYNFVIRKLRRTFNLNKNDTNNSH